MLQKTRNEIESGFANVPIQSAHAFRTLMEVMARPGTIGCLTGTEALEPLSNASAITLLTLADTTTPVFLSPKLDTKVVRDWITFQTGAPIVGSNDLGRGEHASFALGTWEGLLPFLADFPIGWPDYPDRSITLIAELPVLENSGAVLRGPGIQTSVELSLPKSDVFKANRRRFPLGFDAFFTCGDKVAGLPRSTRVEAG